MPEQPNDHDRLVTLETHVQDLRHWREVFTAHLDQKFDAMDGKIESRFTALDTKVDKKVDDLQDHMDQNFGTLRDKLDGTLNNLKLALPTWAQFALYFLVALIGLLGGLLMWHP